MSEKKQFDILSSLGFDKLPKWLEALLGASDILFIILMAWAAHFVSRRLIKGVSNRLSSSQASAEQSRRIQTLERVFLYCANLLVFAITVMLVLSALGISIAPILATAGVVGLAVGFGTQSLVKDYFTGLVLLIENQIRVGDVVELCGKSGVVEELTLRYVQLRDYHGTVHFIPNGNIGFVTSHSRYFAYAVFNIGVSYKEDINRVFSIMRQTASELRNNPDYASSILEDIEISGVDDWAESSVVIKARIKTQALQQWEVRRAYLQSLKNAFDSQGVQIPFPHRTIYTIAADKA